MKFFIWTDFDLDGSGSLLLLKWIYPKVDISFKNTKISAFKEEFTKWSKTDSIDNYDRVFFVDLDVSLMADLVDHEKSLIIDHHITHVSNKGNYKKTKFILEEYTSCALLIYKIFKDKIKLSEQQKKLLILIDDYDSYKHRFKESLELNFLFSDLQKGDYPSKIDRFLAIFDKGFNGFDEMQSNIIQFYKNKVSRTINNCEFYKGAIKLGGKNVRIVSTMADTAINEVCDYILKHDWDETVDKAEDAITVDVAIVFNPKTQSVSFRSTVVDVSKLAAFLCEGGGHKNAAGGKITDKFIEFTKILTKI
jgi:nanoRNase/pAp phosphatase (c-di-AMP/oligoRNAs hydrolase)